MLTLFAVLITFINAYSVSLATKVQNFFTVMKLIAVAIIIFGGAYMLFNGKIITIPRTNTSLKHREFVCTCHVSMHVPPVLSYFTV